MVRLRGAGPLAQHLAQQLLGLLDAVGRYLAATNPQHQIRIGRCLGEGVFVLLERLFTAPRRFEQQAPLEGQPRVVLVDRGYLVERLHGGVELPIAAERATNAKLRAQVVRIERRGALEVHERVFVTALRLSYVTEGAPHPRYARHPQLGGVELGGGEIGPQMMQGLSEGARDAVALHVADALHPIFWCAAALALLGLLFAFLLEEVPLANRMVPQGE